MLLHSFYMHHTIHTESGSDSAFFPKIQIGSGKCSRTPDPIRSWAGPVPISDAGRIHWKKRRKEIRLKNYTSTLIPIWFWNSSFYILRFSAAVVQFR